MTSVSRDWLPRTCAAFLVLVAFVAPHAALAQTADKVTICHIPPGNPANAHTISVDLAALPAHLGHNDTLVPCDICLGVGQVCGGANNGACCAGSICNMTAGVCEVPMCLPQGASCAIGSSNCCSGNLCGEGFCI